MPKENTISSTPCLVSEEQKVSKISTNETPAEQSNLINIHFCSTLIVELIIDELVSSMPSTRAGS